MTLAIDDTLLRSIAPKHRSDWRLWQKKSFNIHRGIIELTARDIPSIDDLASDIRSGVRKEFRPGWLRGFGFGTVIHFRNMPADFTSICEHVDTRNKRHGVWQWMVACVDTDRIAIGIHTWLHGYLRPVYESILQQLEADNYECMSIDADIDEIIAGLQRFAARCRVFQGVAGVVA